MINVIFVGSQTVYKEQKPVEVRMKEKRRRPVSSVFLFALALCAAGGLLHLSAQETPAPSTPTPTAVTSPAPETPTPSAAPSGAAEYVGADTCLSCHQNQAPFKDSIHAKAFPHAKGISFDRSCETCHGPGSLHAAAAGDQSNPGFFTIKNPKALSSKETAQLCLQCHQGGNRFHWEGSAHDSRDVSCLSCHSVHSPQSAGGKGLLAKVTEMETCFQCHQLRRAQMMRSSHMPMREGKMACSDCHNPHGGVGPALLAQASVNENCLSCHADKKGPFLWEHPPVRENCLNCHLPHGSQHDRLLKAKRPRLCQECHIEAQHPTQTSAPTNIHLAARSCTECHPQIHGSNHPSGVRFQR